MEKMCLINAYDCILPVQNFSCALAVCFNFDKSPGHRPPNFSHEVWKYKQKEKKNVRPKIANK